MNICYNPNIIPRRIRIFGIFTACAQADNVPIIVQFNIIYHISHIVKRFFGIFSKKSDKF